MSYELTRALLESWQESAPEPDARHEAKAQAANSFAQFLMDQLNNNNNQTEE